MANRRDLRSHPFVRSTPPISKNKVVICSFMILSFLLLLFHVCDSVPHIQVLNFEYFFEPSLVSFIFYELRVDKGINDLTGQCIPYDPLSQAQDVHIIMFNTLVGRIRIMAYSRPNAFEFIGSDTYTNATATNNDGFFTFMLKQGIGHIGSMIRIVRRYF